MQDLTDAEQHLLVTNPAVLWKSVCTEPDNPDVGLWSTATAYHDNSMDCCQACDGG